MFRRTIARLNWSWFPFRRGSRHAMDAAVVIPKSRDLSQSHADDGAPPGHQIVDDFNSPGTECLESLARSAIIQVLEVVEATIRRTASRSSAGQPLDHARRNGRLAQPGDQHHACRSKNEG